VNFVGTRTETEPPVETPPPPPEVAETTATVEDNNGFQLTNAGIGGIAAGACVFLLLVGLLIAMLIRRRRRSRQLESESFDDNHLHSDDGSLAKRDSLALQPQHAPYELHDNNLSFGTAATGSVHADEDSPRSVDLKPEHSSLTEFDTQMYALDAIAEASSADSSVPSTRYQYSYDAAPSLQKGRLAEKIEETNAASTSKKEYKGHDNSDNNSEVRRVLQMT